MIPDCPTLQGHTWHCRSGAVIDASKVENARGNSPQACATLICDAMGWSPRLLETMLRQRREERARAGPNLGTASGVTIDLMREAFRRATR